MFVFTWFVSLTPFSVTKLIQCFGCEPKEAARVMEANRKKIDAFLTDPKSPPKVFFFFQPRQAAENELFMAVGLSLFLISLAFSRALSHKQLATERN